MVWFCRGRHGRSFHCRGRHGTNKDGTWVLGTHNTLTPSDSIFPFRGTPSAALKFIQFFHNLTFFMDSPSLLSPPASCIISNFVKVQKELIILIYSSSRFGFSKEVPLLLLRPTPQVIARDDDPGNSNVIPLPPHPRPIVSASLSVRSLIPTFIFIRDHFEPHLT